MTGLVYLPCSALAEHTRHESVVYLGTFGKIEQVAFRKFRIVRGIRQKCKLAEQRMKRRKLVDPLQFEMSIAAEDLADYIPQFPWECAPPSDKQIRALEGYGIFAEGVGSAGKASLMLDRLAKRREEGLSTPKQIRFLEGRGFRRVGTWTQADASAMISRISANGWRTPRSVEPATYVPGGGGAA